ncbi:AP2/ERF family transcription factor [Pseudomarimonas salicorniae]|uniref:AP2 domain-containing protein n=1 Tax=Pseudomarimonas salicorniae TaxID=2933270 RepID=A0ABT0GL27_9GAMM|nr:AP2/ERF family transcription factor [Lysobacter sp. CAU 1642]MCK7594747.1 AP2 domain-containing protein [Lysobacter sp. CAU 1642]
MARSKPTGASRVDRPANGAVGWLMRIRRGDTFIQEFFSDAAYGGKRASQRAARDRYSELAATLPPPKTSEGAMSVRNSSGVVGVRLAREGTDAAGEPRESYVASWRENGRDRTVRFSCSAFGKRKAFQLACLARELRTTDREVLMAKLAENRKAGKSAAGKKAAPKKAAKKAAAKKTAKRK